MKGEKRCFKTHKNSVRFFISLEKECKHQKKEKIYKTIYARKMCERMKIEQKFGD